MTPPLRKLALTVHLTCSVGWIGAAIAFLVLVVAAMTSPDTSTLRSAWIAMELAGWFAIAPLALGSMLTGLVMSLGTQWGLFRHYWTLISFALTALAIAVLLGNMRTVSVFAGIAAAGDPDVGALREALRSELLHAGAGLGVLLVIQALNVYKPRGMTAYGRRRQIQQPSVSEAAASPITSRRTAVLGVIVMVLGLLFLLFHLAARALGVHTSPGPRATNPGSRAPLR